jgi:hypothetical protein
MSAPILPVPTPDLVRQAVARFDEDDRYGPADRVLSRVFSDHPLNTMLEDVFIKVVLLNGLYNTNVFAVMDMASHIRDLRIDDDLAAGSPELVDRVARLTIRGKTRRHYSFATKYCSWHRPDEYPIYDSRVEKLLWAYRREHRFAQFSRPDLQEYPKYKEAVAAFRCHFGLARVSFKRLDKFLWLTSKDLATPLR